MKKHINIPDISARFLAGEMSEKEKSQFLQQLKEDKIMQEEFEKMRVTWQRFDSGPAGKYGRTGKAWESLKNRLDQDGLLGSPQQPARSRGFYILRAAAALAILAVLSISTYLVFNGTEKNNYQIISYDAAHATSGYILPDGSRIYLNQGAEIRYAANFNNRRTLILKGEGFFDVRHDPARPFSVKAGNTVITVLGTSFNVKEDNDNSLVEVLVETGKVRVSGKKGNHSITLLPGQFGMSDGRKPVISRQNNSNYLSWKTREFRFVDTNLATIIRSLEQAYHVEVDTGKVNASNLKLTSTYQNQSLESILETICTALDLSYVKTDTGYQLKYR